MADRRDDSLGAALRLLEIPDHGPDFYARLRERLVEESANRSVPSPPSAPRWSHPLLLVATAAAVVVVVLVANVALPGRTRGPGLLGPRAASAAEVRTRVSRALAAARTLRGELTLECLVSVGPCQAPAGSVAHTVVRFSVVATAAGDERDTALGGGPGGDTAYRADQHSERSIGVLNQGLNVSEATGLASGPPDHSVGSPLAREYGSLVRAFLNSGTDAAVIDTTADGHRVWQLAVPVPPNTLAGPGRSGDRIEVVVDQVSGFPLRVTETIGGRFLYELRLSNLVVDAPVDPSVFVLDPPPGTPVSRHDYGFKAVPLDQVAAVVGYQPVLPADLPPGYHLAEVAVARQAPATGTEGTNPPSRNVVSLAYRRGFDTIVVTTRAAGANRAAWDDPLGTSEGIVDQPQRFTVDHGALTGAAAALVVTPRGTPHVWAIDNHLVVTISGDAGRDELTRMLTSLR